jgi:DNA-binding SARP family transcriptional activator
LWQLHQGLRPLTSGALPQTCAEILKADKESVRLDFPLDLHIDVRDFEQAFAPVQGILGERLDSHRATELRKAICLYKGNLLEGWYQDWCLYHRERLENCYLAMLDKLMAYCEYHKDFESGISYGEKLLCQDNARERTHYRLMRLRYFAGDRVGALRQFQRCEAALKEELGVLPSKRTVELREQITLDRVLSNSVEGERGQNRRIRAAEVHSSSLPLSLTLQKLRSVLMRIQRRVQTDIRELDTLLEVRPPSSLEE